MRWVGTRHIFTETATSDESWAVSWERRRSQYVQSYNFPNIILDGWEALKAYFFDKRQSKGAHFKKFPAAPSAAKLLNIFFAALRAVQHGLYTSNLLPTSMGGLAYSMFWPNYVRAKPALARGVRGHAPR